MIVVERTLAVTAAPSQALAYLTDFGNTSEWDPAVRQAVRDDGAGPIVPGATWRQVCKVFGITTELTYTLVEAAPGRLLFHGRNEGATCTDTITVRPVEGGAEVTYRLELEMHGLAKLAAPVIKMEFEKLGTASAARLTGALNALAGQRTTEVQRPHTALPLRSQEAQA